MCWLPLNRCLPHTASEAPWCDVTAFSHQPHWYTDDANDRTTLYTLFKHHMIKQRQQLGIALSFFFRQKKLFINMAQADCWTAASSWEHECLYSRKTIFLFFFLVMSRRKERKIQRVCRSKMIKTLWIWEVRHLEQSGVDRFLVLRCTQCLTIFLAEKPWV